MLERIEASFGISGVCLRFAHPAEAIVAGERLLVEISVAILFRVIVVLMVTNGGSSSSSSRKAL